MLGSVFQSVMILKKVRGHFKKKSYAYSNNQAIFWE